MRSPSAPPIPNSLRERRGSKPLGEIASQIGVSSTTLGRYETGGLAVPDEKKIALAKLYRTSVPRLFDFSG